MTAQPTRPLRYVDATQVIARRQAEVIQRSWRSLEPGSLHGSFAAHVLPVFLAAVTSGQTQAAALATPYVAGLSTLNSTRRGSQPCCGRRKGGSS